MEKEKSQRADAIRCQISAILYSAGGRAQNFPQLTLSLSVHWFTLFIVNYFQDKTRRQMTTNSDK
jgi:hypothetical protein